MSAELYKLLRPRASAGVILAGALMGTLGSVTVHGGMDVPVLNDPDTARLLNRPQGLVAGVLGPFTVFLCALGAGFTANQFAGDLTLGNMRTQLVVHPRRGGLLAGKAAAGGVIVVLIVLAALLAAALTALIVGPDQVRDETWLTADGARAAARTAGLLCLSVLAYSAAGFGSALLIRSTGPAILVPVIYLLSVDGLVGQAIQGMSEQVANWMPQSNLVDLARGGDYGRPLLFALVFAAALFAAGAVSFRRRDVL
ncbi:ABC transporter permease subunit [Actinomadura sp. KC06]|uniref:ABC transporter permease subunit n=1 Tax=Actinomadura sp. KC06 TaxID=2530369 RepID=UPI001404E1BC|nr:ABC transporter permease subunit [Actinomadura sp. KC06]